MGTEKPRQMDCCEMRRTVQKPDAEYGETAKLLPLAAETNSLDVSGRVSSDQRYAGLKPTAFAVATYEKVREILERGKIDWLAFNSADKEADIEYALRDLDNWSSYLGTIFGVRGPHITRKMVADHSGVRKVSNDALTFIHGFTGDGTVTRRQWDAFQKLVSASRAEQQAAQARIAALEEQLKAAQPARTTKQAQREAATKDQQQLAEAQQKIDKLQRQIASRKLPDLPNYYRQQLPTAEFLLRVVKDEDYPKQRPRDFVARSCATLGKSRHDPEQPCSPRTARDVVSGSQEKEADTRVPPAEAEPNKPSATYKKSVRRSGTPFGLCRAHGEYQGWYCPKCPGTNDVAATRPGPPLARSVGKAAARVDRAAAGAGRSGAAATARKGKEKV